MYRPGKHNQNADALSRLGWTGLSPDSDDNEDTEEMDACAVFETSQTTPSPDVAETLASSNLTTNLPEEVRQHLHSAFLYEAEMKTRSGAQGKLADATYLPVIDKEQMVKIQQNDPAIKRLLC